MTANSDEEFERLAAHLTLIDIPTTLNDPPLAFSGPFEEKAKAHNMLNYLKSTHGLDGLVTWRSVTR